MEHLFIGGCADGRWIDVVPEGRPWWRVAPPSHWDWTPTEETVASVRVRVHEYARSDWFIGPRRNDVRSVYVLNGMGPEAVWDALTKGYRGRNDGE